jgi:hypothetical protein
MDKSENAMWIAIIGCLLAAFVAGLLFISFRAAEFRFVQRLTGCRKGAARLICLAVFAVLTAALWLVWNMMNAVLCMVHLVVFWLLCDGIVCLAARLRRRAPRREAAGIAAIVICVLYLSAGWFAVHHVWQTEYTFVTPKLDRPYRIVQITDSHIGATFDAEGFSRHIEKINALSPDAVVLTGDFVDDDTTRENMLGGCAALSGLKTTCGVFFVYGNHDRGYYSAEARGWSGAELRDALEANGVVILEDAICDIGDGLIIAGRKDRSVEQRGGARKTAAELLCGLDQSAYIVLLDHQPHDFDAEAAAGADLVLCGHTHGGQFIPINHVGEWIGENCLRYGHEKRLDTDFIVSSGISNWTFRFKTGCKSEYVVIDLIPATEG